MKIFEKLVKFKKGRVVSSSDDDVTKTEVFNSQESPEKLINEREKKKFNIVRIMLFILIPVMGHVLFFAEDSKDTEESVVEVKDKILNVNNLPSSKSEKKEEEQDASKRDATESKRHGVEEDVQNIDSNENINKRTDVDLGINDQIIEKNKNMELVQIAEGATTQEKYEIEKSDKSYSEGPEKEVSSSESGQNETLKNEQNISVENEVMSELKEGIGKDSNFEIVEEVKDQKSIAPSIVTMDGQKENSLAGLYEKLNVPEIDRENQEIDKYHPPPDYQEDGKGLVYNCKGGHWACVAKMSYFKCSRNQKWAIKNGKEKECVTFEVYKNDRQCRSVHQHYVHVGQNNTECDK